MTVTTLPSVHSPSDRVAFIPSRGQVRAVIEADGGGPVRVASSQPGGEVETVDDAIILPNVGESVTVDDETGLWLGLIPGSGSDGQVTVWLLCGSVVREVRRPAAAWHAAQCVTGPAQADVGAALSALALATQRAHTLNESMVQQREARQRWCDALVADLHEEAERRDFCSDFDDWMDDHGLPGRTLEWSVPVDVTARVMVTVSASNAESACEAVDTDMVRDALRFAHVDYEDWETDEDSTERL